MHYCTKCSVFKFPLNFFRFFLHFDVHKLRTFFKYFSCHQLALTLLHCFPNFRMPTYHTKFVHFPAMFLIRAVIHNWWQTAFRHLLFIPTCWLFRAKLRSPVSGWRVAAEKNRLTFFSHSFDRFWTNGSSQTLAAAYENNSQQLFSLPNESTCFFFFNIFIIFGLWSCAMRAKKERKQRRNT